MRRRRVSSRGSRRVFTKYALRVNRRNVPSMCRGGIRF